jgi:very-short-patch-repair endonuclease
MGDRKFQPRASAVWELARRQHGVVTRAQLLALGLNHRGIEHRRATGRLHSLYRGVYAVGRPALTPHGRWIAAVLSCGPSAALSHGTAAALWEIAERRGSNIDVSVPAHVGRRRPGIRVHRRAALGTAETSTHLGIPVTTPALTLIDLASTLPRGPVEAAINAADRLELVTPESLRATLAGLPHVPGAAAIRAILDRQTFRLTDSDLERRLLHIVRRVGLPVPETGVWLNGFKVDFYWRELGLVVETDGLRYHRTPSEQARDRRRDQAHTAAGLTPLRFTHAQVRFEADGVAATLTAVANRLRPRNR